ncbi:MAG TPA: pyruvate:ferredoxin (flavodoxin) oxidoreductase [Propionibacteriaceae bacterium]|nr:pyruvate:ferredoxin (flavodoxin) oxidoreductase [Propionibacteriaceae bacterium]
MYKREMVTFDGNEATAHVAHQVSEVIAIYPITPSSAMGEHADAKSARGETNIWGTVPSVVEMQSEGGAAGAVHGALQTGALSTTFTASQGLLLMIPSMFKIAGELTPTVFHVSARAVACQALSIFGDQSDVMGVRSTGFALLASGSVQEAMDQALIAHAATLEARVPFVHFFDGFRTSSELNKIEQLGTGDIRAMIDDELVFAHRARALNPDRPVLRGTSQNPDVYFQGRETVNPFYLKTPEIVQKAMDKFAGIVGRQYHLFDYVGAPDAERVIVLMGSGVETAHETVEYVVNRGEKVGVLKVRLYRPFSIKHFIDALPKTTRLIAALDRTKEPGSAGEPLYLDCVNAITESGLDIRVIGGRYGLSSKEFNPAMIKGVFDEMKKAEPKNHFTVGIIDDVTHTSIAYDPKFNIESDDTIRAMFFGLGSDGTVGANHNSIRIIGDYTPNYAQGYFVYDSKKAGTVTVSHLRFGPRPIRQTCLISSANFIGCHQFVFLEKYDVLESAAEGAVFLLNSPYSVDEVWDQLPRPVQQTIIDKKLKFFVIDAYSVAKDTGMGVRINTIMQTCFFAISGVLPRDEAISAIKSEIERAYGKKGKDVVQKNFEAVDQTLANLHEVKVPAKATSTIEMPPTVSPLAPEFVQEVTAEIMARRGDSLPVSKMPVDGTYPTATTQWEKRNVALEIPVWDPEVCIQCGKCSLACPHASIRMKVYDAALLANAPETFKSVDARGKEFKGMKFTIQVAPEDCTGCGVCVEACPAKNKTEPSRKAINLQPQIPLRFPERENFAFFMSIPDYDRSQLNVATVKGSQLLRPLFEFSGACAGCGETPYVKLLTQLFGDRAVISNATGCSSIYGGNLPTTPYAQDSNGRGPAWNNSLFEDNAEFGLGFRLTLDKHSEFARELVGALRDDIGSDLADALLNAVQTDEDSIAAQRARVVQLKDKLQTIAKPQAKQLFSLAETLVKRSVWILGGDGWAYDIGYGGLDHVLASGRNVNVLVLDTGVYSNTGGQMSKATPRGAVAKFAAAGKPLPKKDLGLMAMNYSYVYVAKVAFGANDNQTVKAFVEAEAYNGPSLIIAYSHCIAHGYDLAKGLDQQKLAVDAGYWPLYRFDPRRAATGESPLMLDSAPPKIDLAKYTGNETRYRVVEQMDPARFKMLAERAQREVTMRFGVYEQLAKLAFPVTKP